jgi:hypothetical protein
MFNFSINYFENGPTLFLKVYEKPVYLKIDPLDFWKILF